MAKDFSSQSSYPLGMRNNNPGNLRNGIAWLGGSAGANGFVKFRDVSWGLRAMALDLSTKITKDGLNTISEIITKYAPPSENDTAAYIRAVAQDTGWNKDNTISISEDNLLRLMRAIINHEQGNSYSALLSDSDILEGISKMPDNVLNLLGSFFAENPGIEAAAGVGLVAVIIVVIVLLIKYKKINTETFTSFLK
jgi:hypothetical protein